ncbi:DUF6346 domain-containing protein [Lentzea sp. NBRC 102530]|uniref:DUF6346 domain-containing protein n=1 Tax=Lentzea sp. NBRC 102530 TaxID=3032201 RepID=UPI0024A38121|nr:DUF6346 domain-containing protein [Lentzea sp. NBRC 102530]GLY48920.1 hypothetical protein Lesp01_25760 [Lentzea sp. NBRC 102530]
MTKYRKRRNAVACLVLGLYLAAFVGAFWADRGDGGPAVATAEEIQCSRNWFLLGTRWSCSAVVTDTDGKQYRYTNDSSVLTPADIGTKVPMEKFTYKKSPPTFSPARASFSPMPWHVIGMFALIILAFTGAFALWPRDRFGWPADPAKRRAEAQRLRAQWPWNTAIGVLALYGAYFVHGVFVVAHIDDDGIVALRTQGTGVAQSCGRDWRYLGVVWRCTVEVAPQTGTKVTQTMSQSQFTPDDIGKPAPVTLFSGDWEAVDQPYESRFAKVVVVLLVLMGTVIAKPLSNLQMARRLENTNPARDALNRNFLS